MLKEESSNFMSEPYLSKTQTVAIWERISYSTSFPSFNLMTDLAGRK